MTTLMPTPREAAMNQRSGEVVEESADFRRTCWAGAANARMTFSLVLKMAATKLSLLLDAPMSRSVGRARVRLDELLLLGLILDSNVFPAGGGRLFFWFSY